MQTALNAIYVTANVTASYFCRRFFLVDYAQINCVRRIVLLPLYAGVA